MPPTSEEFLNSVVTGAFGAAFLALLNWIVKELWNSKVSPWYENKIYSDARVDGLWETRLVTQIESTYKERAVITQVGHHITGTLECVDGVDRGNSYKFVGVMRNTILSAYYWNTKSSALDSGSFTLRLEENGEKLVGFTTYYYDVDHSLKSRDYIWKRI